MTMAPTRSGRPTSAIPDAGWTSAVGLLRAAGSVVLVCHVNPDGDAVGSMLGLGLALRAAGIPAVASFGGGPELPPTYRLLPGQDLIRHPADLPPAPAVLVTLDTNSPERLGELEPLLDSAGAVLVLDHHAQGDGFGSHHLVDREAAATAVLAEELVTRLGVPLDRDIAACLYTGLTTDTGSFKYASTTAATHELAARLLATGLRHDRIARLIWDTSPFGYVRLLGLALTRAVLEPDAVGGLGLVWTTTTADELAEHGLTMPEIEGIIDVVRTADTAEVAVVLKGDLDGTVKVSTRSKGRIDVGAICVRQGGGGHRFAAGFTSYDDPLATMATVRSALAEAPHLPE